MLLPPLSQAIARGETERFGRLVDQALRLTLYVVIPLTGLMLVLSTPTLSLLFQHGIFTPEATSIAVPVFVVFLLGLVAHVLISLLAPIFYAGKNTRTPVAAAILAVAVDVVAAAVLFPYFGLEAWRWLSASGRGRKSRCCSTSCGAARASIFDRSA